MREILFNICMVAVACALFKLLVPENSFRKQIGFLVSCFFITAVISFITGGDFSIEGISIGESGAGFIDYSEEVTTERKRAIAEELSNRVREMLAEHEIFPARIYVIVNISGMYSISINEIKLVLPPDSDFTRASALVEKEVGTEIKVTFVTEDSR
jgi:hypothetical protein